ncbi:MAG: four helix bundle protein [Anaerolineales bacterium]|nr:four helix bundle protein [Anaerolineales bacterium]
MTKGDDIEARLFDFAVQIVYLTDKMPRSRAGDHLAGQLLRSGTSPAAHYAEARGAESLNDFIHKLKLCVKELNESRIWLKIILGSKMPATGNLPSVFSECDELCRIIHASIRTAKNKQRSRQ